MSSTTDVVRPSLFDLVLRGQEQLSALLVDESFLHPAVQKLIGLSVAGFGLHGLVTGAATASSWTGALWLTVVFVTTFLGALCICLPSFYFYTQLAGYDASFRLVTAQALRATATTSVLLLGTAPFLGAYALAGGHTYAVGVALPFAVGSIGLVILHRSFRDLSRLLPQMASRRSNLLTFMILCWGAVYTAVAVVMLWRLLSLDPFAARIG